MSSLVLESVTVTLNNRALFAPLTLTVEPGVVVTVVGPSGAGKSSLLACLAGALPEPLAAQGHVRLGDELLDEKAPEDRRLGILFQDDLLFPHLAVGGNLAFGMRPQLVNWKKGRRPFFGHLLRFRRQKARFLPAAQHEQRTSDSLLGGRTYRRSVISEALASMDLMGFEDRDPATLSGGQRARVALLRVLLSEPRALLLDEPFGRLDAASRDTTRERVFNQARQRKLPTLLVTHDDVDAKAAAGPVVELKPAI